MKKLILIPFVFLTSCASLMPDIAKIVDDIEDTAICVEVNRDAMQQDTDIHVKVDVINKDPPKIKVADSQKNQ